MTIGQGIAVASGFGAITAIALIDSGAAFLLGLVFICFGLSVIVGSGD